MKLSTDHAFRIGHAHLRNGRPCQDYATSRVLPHAAYAIVSDGCSSAGETDVGARLVALGLATSYRTILDETGVPPRTCDVDLARRVESCAWERTLGGARELWTPQEDLYATLVHACVAPGVGAFVRVLGDGVVAILTRDGVVRAVRCEWAGSRPAYPAYRIGDGHERFYASHGGADARAFAWEVATSDNGARTTTRGTAGFGVRGYGVEFNAEELCDVAAIGVFSDGVTMVGERDWFATTCDLMALRGTGAVAQRRVTRFLARLDAGEHAEDDLAMAVIRIEHEEQIDGE